MESANVLKHEFDRSCQGCGAPMQASELYCARCGAAAVKPARDSWATTTAPPLESEPATLIAPSPRLATEPTSTDVESDPPRDQDVRHRGIPLYPLAGGVLAVLVIAVLGFMWNGAAAANARTERELSLAQATIRTTTRTNTKLVGQLDHSRKLASRRAVVLQQAQKVLGQVTPLFSAVDELKNISGDMKHARNQYEIAASTLSGNLIYLGNYLLDAGDYADYGFVGDQIDEINSGIDEVNGYSDRLTALDSRYSKSSDRFDTRASIFNDAIEELKTKTLQTEAITVVTP
jgi:hypothetical protein